jgi:hypothetical protein
MSRQHGRAPKVREKPPPKVKDKPAPKSSRRPSGGSRSPGWGRADIPPSGSARTGEKGQDATIPRADPERSGHRPAPGSAGPGTASDRSAEGQADRGGEGGGDQGQRPNSRNWARRAELPPGSPLAGLGDARLNSAGPGRLASGVERLPARESDAATAFDRLKSHVTASAAERRGGKAGRSRLGAPQDETATAGRSGTNASPMRESSEDASAAFLGLADTVRRQARVRGTRDIPRTAPSGRLRITEQQSVFAGEGGSPPEAPGVHRGPSRDWQLSRTPDAEFQMLYREARDASQTKVEAEVSKLDRLREQGTASEQDERRGRFFERERDRRVDAPIEKWAKEAPLSVVRDTLLTMHDGLRKSSHKSERVGHTFALLRDVYDDRVDAALFKWARSLNVIERSRIRESLGGLSKNRAAARIVTAIDKAGARHSKEMQGGKRVARERTREEFNRMLPALHGDIVTAFVAWRTRNPELARALGGLFEAVGGVAEGRVAHQAIRPPVRSEGIVATGRRSALTGPAIDQPRGHILFDSRPSKRATRPDLPASRAASGAPDGGRPPLPGARQGEAPIASPERARRRSRASQEGVVDADEVPTRDERQKALQRAQAGGN